MFCYKLDYADGSEAGDAAYADWVNVGETVMLGPGNTVRVVDVVLIDEEEGSPYAAPLQVEAV